MIKRGEFRFNEPVNIAVASQLSQMTIFLSLCQSQRADPRLYSISGFPRCLASEDTLNGNVTIGFPQESPTDTSPLATRLEKRAELIRQRRYNARPVANDPKVVTLSDAPLVGEPSDFAKSETKDPRRRFSSKKIDDGKADDGRSFKSATSLWTKPSPFSSVTHRSSSGGGARPRFGPLDDAEALSPTSTSDARGCLDDPSSTAAWAENFAPAADDEHISVEMLRSQAQGMLKATVVHAERVISGDSSSTTFDFPPDDSEEGLNLIMGESVLS